MFYHPAVQAQYCSQNWATLCGVVWERLLEGVGAGGGKGGGGGCFVIERPPLEQ
jgi:hypothetical protein